MMFVNYTILGERYQVGPYGDDEVCTHQRDIKSYCGIVDCYVTPYRDNTRINLSIMEVNAMTTIYCNDCGKQIYEDAADEIIGGKHARVYDLPVMFIVCMDCSLAYEHIEDEVLGESYEPIGDIKSKDKNK